VVDVEVVADDADVVLLEHCAGASDLLGRADGGRADADVGGARQVSAAAARSAPVDEAPAVEIEVGDAVRVAGDEAGRSERCAADREREGGEAFHGGLQMGLPSRTRRAADLPGWISREDTGSYEVG